MTSHAAVVARGWGKCCVAGAGDLQIDDKGAVHGGRPSYSSRRTTISIDGSTGEVMHGAVPRSTPELSRRLRKVMRWADKYRTLGVRTNADTPADAKRARDFGAEGIGLCRTEHMFFEGDRIVAMREMILAERRAEREAALEKLLPYQREDFIGIFEAMKGLPVTIRLLDPPLHEFLPARRQGSRRPGAKQLGVKPVEKVKAARRAAARDQPDARAPRLPPGVTYPEILEMQVRAIVEAAIECKKKRKVRAMPEIMIPLVGTSKELAMLARAREETIAEAEAIDFTGARRLSRSAR
jgi:pyruvate,orthophosphate dikinase